MNRFVLLCLGLFSLTNSTSIAQTISSEELLNHLKTLSSDAYQGRGNGTDGAQLARNHIVEVFEEIGLEKIDTTYEQSFPFYSRRLKKKGHGINLIGLIKGTSAPEQYIVLTAHYDHLGIRKDSIYNGADDNGSGTCALFYLASYFKENPPTHSILIVAFDAEELGLRGAKHFVEEPPVPLENIIVNINMDMIGRNVHNEIYICGTYHYPSLKKVLKKPTRKSALKVSFGHDNPKLERGDDWTFSSDHGEFHKKKIPFLYFGVEDHPDYHMPSDDFNRIMPEFYMNAVQLVLESIRQIDRKMHKIVY